MEADYGPFKTEDLVATAVEALKIQGDARAIAVLAAGKCYLKQTDSDFGVDYWLLLVELPPTLFFLMEEEERNAVQQSIMNVVKPCFAKWSNDDLGAVVVAPLVAEAQLGWREDAVRFVKGEGVTNQGRVRSDNIASQQHQGLLFRSKAEIMLFNAMTRARLAVAPLPVFVRIGKKYNRLEPDFVVLHKGLTFIVEVDGDTFHRELPAEAEKRLLPLTHEGVEVRRIRAADITTESAADQVVKELVGYMDHRKEAR